MLSKLKRTFVVAMSLIMLFAFIGCSAQQAQEPTEPSSEPTEAAQPEKPAEEPGATPSEEQNDEPETRIIIDHAGNEIEIPAQIDRVATMSIFPFTSTLAMYLGSAEKIVGMHPVSMAASKNGILAKMYPEVLDAESNFMTGMDLNIEELMKLNPDVVFYNCRKKEMHEALVSAGIPAIGVDAVGYGFDCVKTYDEWIKLLNQVFPGEGEAVMKTIDYGYKVYDDIQAKVADIPDDQRKKVMFLFQYDENTMITSGKKFFGQYWINAAGGINVAEGMEEVASNAIISMEQVYEWNPDIIYITNFTGTQPEDLYNNAIGGDDWSNVKAVQDKQVYKMPLGTYRSYTPTADTPLTLLWMAKTMYPEIFADLDMDQEVKDYFKEFFSYEVSDEDVKAIFNPDRDAAALGDLT